MVVSMESRSFPFGYEITARRYPFRSGPLEVLALRDLDATIDALFANVQGTPTPEQERRLEALCPYFGVVWAAGHALAQWVDRWSNRLENKRFLELGCGLGLPSMVASRAGARVTALDVHPHVGAFLKENCQRNGLPPVDFLEMPWQGAIPLGSFDWIVGSDVLYERTHPKPLVQFLHQHLAPRGVALITDPDRPYWKQFSTLALDAGFEMRGNWSPGAAWGTDQRIGRWILRRRSAQ